MKHYNHLTQIQRYQISALIKTGISKTEIANILGVNKSTIYRELSRNTGTRGYRPKQAHRLSLQRKANNSQKITDFCWSITTSIVI